jgi:hypothetical protein
MTRQTKNFITIILTGIIFYNIAVLLPQDWFINLYFIAGWISGVTTPGINSIKD